MRQWYLFAFSETCYYQYLLAVNMMSNCWYYLNLLIAILDDIFQMRKSWHWFARVFDVSIYIVIENVFRDFFCFFPIKQESARDMNSFHSLIGCLHGLVVNISWKYGLHMASTILCACSSLPSQAKVTSTKSPRSNKFRNPDAMFSYRKKKKKGRHFFVSHRTKYESTNLFFFYDRKWWHPAQLLLITYLEIVPAQREFVFHFFLFRV